MKQLTFRTLDEKNADVSTVAWYFGNRTGMGYFKDYELWQIKVETPLMRKGPYYLAIKNDLCLIDITFTNILNHIDSENGQLGTKGEAVHLEPTQEAVRA